MAGERLIHYTFNMASETMLDRTTSMSPHAQYDRLDDAAECKWCFNVKIDATIALLLLL